MKRGGLILSASAALVAVLVLGLLMTPIGRSAPARADSATMGNWLGPFEHGGDPVPLCNVIASAGPYATELVCKPTAVTSVPLYNGKILYWNGIEASENAIDNAVLEGGRVTRDDQTRVLDLSGAQAAWSIPSPERGGAVNPEIAAGNSPDDPWANDGGLFCSDQVSLADGRILAAGGTDFWDRGVGQGAPVDPRDFLPIPPDADTIIELEGLRNARIYNPATNTWTQSGHMNYGRWYPQLVTLPDGKIFVASGVKLLIQNTTNDATATNGQARLTEIYDPATGVWTANETAKNDLDVLESLPLFPRMHLTPNGKIYFGGVGQTFGPMGHDPQQSFWGLNRFYNLTTKAWELVVPAGSSPNKTDVRGGAFQIALQMQPPYTSMTLLIGGGTLGPTPGDNVANTISEKVTINAAGAVTRDRTAGQLTNARWFSSAQILPTGEVLAFSGANRDEVVEPGNEAPVHTAEIYNPATDSWTALAPGRRDRTYHNTAVLLADGRVLVGGHSPIPYNYTFHQQQNPALGLANNFKDPSFEVFEPPYLFRGARPDISYAPSRIAWGSQFPVAVDNAQSIESVVLISLPTLTHVVDPDLRSLKLNFQVNNGILQVAAPPNGLAAPPGPYYLFVNKTSTNGPIPSVARVVFIGGTTSFTAAPEPLQSSSAAASSGSANPVPVTKADLTAGGPTSVALASFTGKATRRGVALTWTTASEIDTLGFDVWRVSERKTVKVNRSLVVAKGALGGATYRLLDRSARAESAYVYYRLEAVNRGGTRSWRARTAVRARR